MLTTIHSWNKWIVEGKRERERGTGWEKERERDFIISLSLSLFFHHHLFPTENRQQQPFHHHLSILSLSLSFSSLKISLSLSKFLLHPFPLVPQCTYQLEKGVKMSDSEWRKREKKDWMREGEERMWKLRETYRKGSQEEWWKKHEKKGWKKSLSLSRPTWVLLYFLLHYNLVDE